MGVHYSSEKVVQIVIALLKKNKIHRIIVSPGSANDAFVYSVQSDSFFTLYSCIDERSAAYMACGIAEETNEPVVLSCTGATASRNYIPGLTEAFYRKLPIIAITATRPIMYVGHNVDQLMDRSVVVKDAIKYSVSLPVVKDDEDFWDCEIKANIVFSELTKDGGGPVHINMPTIYSHDYSVTELPAVRMIERIDRGDDFPSLEKKRIAIYVASHKTMDPNLTDEIDKFCEKYNAVVFCEHTSGYNGKFKVPFYIVNSQPGGSKDYIPDIEIELGGIAGIFRMPAYEVWRVCDDGEIRDTQKRLKKIFYMDEKIFFSTYVNMKNGSSDNSYYKLCINKLNLVYSKIPHDLPFSNLYIASRLSSIIPKGSEMHFGILNSLRCWNYFKLDDSIKCFANVGGYGIDGCISSLIGASLIHPQKLYYGVFGDLAFFYDLNSLGNRHIGNNVRIILINNGLGSEFKNYFSPAYEFGDDANSFICAEGHYGNKSKELIRNFAAGLGFDYYSASNVEEFEINYRKIINPEIGEKSMIFEIFTDPLLDAKALKIINNIDISTEQKMKSVIKGILGKN